ncbi:hypothetical protein ACFX12_025036 [Malus domestica]
MTRRAEQHRLISSPTSTPPLPRYLRRTRPHAIASTRKLEWSDPDFILKSARSSFYLALIECQDWRSRSEELLKKLYQTRPASLDLNNNAFVSSPRLGTIKKGSMASRKSSNFPNPGTQSYWHANLRV